MQKIIATICIGVGLAGCAISSPFKTTDDGAWKAAEQTDEYFVVIAHATLNPSQDARRVFNEYNDPVVDAIDDQPGLVGRSFRLELSGDEAWRMTVWKDEASVAAFMFSEPHASAMEEARSTLAAERFARFWVPAGDGPPDWDRALAELDARMPKPRAIAAR